MKKLLGIVVMGLLYCTSSFGETFAINQRSSGYERRKGAPTLENHTGSWRLFTALAIHLG